MNRSPMRAWVGRILTAAAVAAAADAVVAQVPVGTSFTYQGRLSDGGSPASGSFDFRFTLFDAAVGGAAVGAPVSANGVPVALGLFTSALDFGPAAFAGQARWVQVEVRPAGGGAFTTLLPRQELTPAPNALFSSRTDPANLTSLNASNLTSGTLPGPRLAGTYALALSLTNGANAISGTFTGSGAGLTSLAAGALATGTVPSAVVSGTYSNAITLSNPANQLAGNGAGLTNLNAQPRLLRTVVASPLSSPVANGNALLAALASITTASATNPFLLKIEPGLYDVGTTSFVMKPFVDVEGSGEGATKITGLGSASNLLATVQAVTNSELRHLTVENRGGAAFAKALFVDGGAPRITHVSALAFGGTTESQGFFAQNGATATVRHLTVGVQATGSAASFGVLNITGSSSVFFDLNASANGGQFARAIATYNGSTPTFRSTVAIGSGATTENMGVASYQSSPVYENLVAIATGNATNNLGCLTFVGPNTATFRLATCRALNATGINYGLLTNGGANTTVVDLTAEAVGGTQARAIEHNGCGGGTTLTHARAFAAGATSEVIGLLNASCSPRIVDLDANAAGAAGANVHAVRNFDGAPLLTHVTANASGETGIVMGIDNAASSPTLEHVTANATGGTVAYGVLNEPGTSWHPTLRSVSATGALAASFSIGVATLAGTGGGASLADVTATANGTTGSIAGAYNDGGAISLTNVVATASGSGGSRNGLIVGPNVPTVTTVDRSTLSGPNGSVRVSAGSTLRVAGSQLAGPLVNLGTASCLFSYNGTYAALNATCQ